mgnify:CR=1 FL=1|tara:strand:- start:261 stop:932 length:672 start_codon:yes stop_codon:yes gene_type:complete
MKDHVLIEPPPSEKERVEELKEVSEQYQNRFNPEFLQPYLDEKPEVLFYEYLKRNGESAIPVLRIKDIMESIYPFVKLHKEFFEAARPKDLAKKHDIKFQHDKISSAANSYSYPSGHTAQAFYGAIKLSEIFPNLKEGLMGIANMVAESRLDRGVHIRSDNNAGKQLAEEIIRLENNAEALSDKKPAHDLYSKLIQISNELDSRGLYKEASLLDEILTSSAIS